MGGGEREIKLITLYKDYAVLFTAKMDLFLFKKP